MQTKREGDPSLEMLQNPKIPLYFFAMSSVDSLFHKGNAKLYLFHFEQQNYEQNLELLTN